jgi:hypothetical protein
LQKASVLPIGSKMSDDKTAKEVTDAKRNLGRSAFILVLALLLWPLGLFINALVSLLIFALLAVFGSVATYIAYMHLLSAKNKTEPKL